MSLNAAVGPLDRWASQRFSSCAHTRNRDNFGVGKYGGAVGASADTFKISTRNVIDEERQYLSSKRGVTALSKYVLPMIQLISAERGYVSGR